MVARQIATIESMRITMLSVLVAQMISAPNIAMPDIAFMADITAVCKRDGNFLGMSSLPRKAAIIKINTRSKNIICCTPFKTCIILGVVDH